MTRKSLVKPKPKTVKKAEHELHGRNVSKTAKSPAGYVVRNAKGIRYKRGNATTKK